METQRKQEKHKLRKIVDSWKENLSPTEYELIHIGLYRGLPVLLVLLIAGWLFIEDHEAFRTLTLSLAAFFGLPLLAWRGVSLDRSSKAAEKQAENASKSHVADTYTKAIEQLGAVDNKGEPNLELRLGGLYALEKIAKANEDYHPQIMEVLCAYVRMHCPIDYDPEEDDSEQHFEPLGIDIRACLNVIGRREVSFDKIPLDLIEVQLIGANLRGTSFNKADLTKANLSKTDLIEADFTQAELMGADLSEAILNRANFSGANFKFVILNHAHFKKTDLSGAKNLTCKQIESAKIDRETKLPDYIKITWAEGANYTCEMMEGFRR